MQKGFAAALLVAAVLLAPLGRGLGAQSPITVVAPGVVTVHADGVPLGDLLRQLSTMVAMDRLKIAPAALASPVTLHVEQVPVTEAMFLVLKASDVDYVMSGTRLLAGGAGAAAAGGAGREERAAGPVARPAAAAGDLDAEREGARERLASTAVPAGGAAGDTGVVDTPAVSDPTADLFGFLVGAEAVQFKVIEDSAVITTPGFVPYKLRPEVVARRKAIDPAKIP